MTNGENILALHNPKNALPVIFDSPHSGRVYPPDFNYSCDLNDLKKIEDLDVDDLFSAAPKHGASLLLADFPRSYIDVNRARDDIDDSLVTENSPTQELGKLNPTSRSDAGIGLISRLIKPGIPIYNRTLSAAEIMNRITTYYDPYHAMLEKLLDEAYYNYGAFWHINCHSMPAASAYPRKNVFMSGSAPRPSDIVLGDLDGQTCGRDFLYALRDFWKSQGFRVTINDPFKGVELIRRHAQPTRGKNSIQIEINRALYMNEITGERLDTYSEFKTITEGMIGFTCAFARSKLTLMAAD